jgi:hypothetical protein
MAKVPAAVDEEKPAATDRLKKSKNMPVTRPIDKFGPADEHG